MAIAATAVLAVAITAGLTLLMDTGPSPRPAVVVADQPVPGTRAVAPPAPIAPAPLEARRPLVPPDTVTSPQSAEDSVASGPAPRIVGGPGISPGPVSHGPMEREAPPATREVVDDGPAWQAFTQVVVIGAGTLNLGGRKVQLAGITVPESGTRCRTTPVAEAFDCAFLSMQALRQRLRARGVECRLSALETIGVEPAACRIGSTDLGEWLVEQGWAEPAPDAPEDYRTAEDTARCAAAGIWAEAPRPDSCPVR
ncbi:thermonuclease family protein [Mesorhizobium sp. BR1-1-16]|uniref:thermonuclease family protein n=1 Tax=Mesorhizobium sp. BR1-1-16 TaxID=2876653 RepID=UPI001CCD019C|nr:thermonuclease family protein [Mesorhizobium sp. BR1-1-16]MBZ9935972.1 thermonuclease family protein [Mesorhizobium sp. BR1-1-16]